MTAPKSAVGTSLRRRLSGALRRRMARAWSRWTAAGCIAPAEAALEWLVGHGRAEGIPAGGDSSAGRPGVTGGAVETALTFGAVDAARRWGAWLVSVQWPDGSVPAGPLDTASLFDTAGAARGLLALERELPDVRAAAVAACQYLRSRITAAGRFSAAQPRLRGSTLRSSPTQTHLACLPPLIEAARRFSQPDWEATARRALEYHRRVSDPDLARVPTHAAAWWIETLIDLGRRDVAAQAMHRIERLQRRNGSVLASPGGGWISSEGMAHLAVCWYKLGRRDRADRALRYLVRRQNRSGGFLGGWGRGVPSRRRTELAWTAKHFLDAARLQVETAFEQEDLDLPDWIDPADGRVAAVRRWMEKLPRDARIADVGCGQGRFLRHLAQWNPAASLTGVDVSTALLSQLPPSVTAVQGSLLRIPLPDGALDGALAVESLEHCLLPRRAVAELCRIVRPGGRVLIIDKDRRRQGLSLHRPWERWFAPDELSSWLSRDCDRVAVDPTSHLEGPPDKHLFLAASGRRKTRK